MKLNFLTAALALLALLPCLKLHAQFDIRDGLVLDYPLDETAGNVAYEAVSGYNATYSGGDPNWQSPGVLFNSGDQRAFVTGDVTGLREHFSLVARIRSDNTTGWRGVIDLNHLSMIIIDGKLVLENRADPWDINEAGSTGFGNSDSNGSIVWGTWHHVVITNNGSRTRFYIDGVLDRELTQRVVSNATNDIRIGVRNAGAIDYFHGAIAGVRVYGRELTPSEVGYLNSPPAPGETMTGLWVGEAILDEVKEVTTGEWGAAGAPFPSKMIVYSDVFDNLSLLQEATVMLTREATPQEAVISRPELSANYDGIIPRGDKRIGVRFSSSSFPLPSDKVDFAGTGNGDEVTLTVTLPAAHPKNPFRHKYHPDLGMGRAITRTITIDWEDGDEPNDGVISGLITETITGLHKDPLEARGTVTFTRASLSQLLNP